MSCQGVHALASGLFGGSGSPCMIEVCYTHTHGPSVISADDARGSQCCKAESIVRHHKYLECLTIGYP